MSVERLGDAIITASIISVNEEREACFDSFSTCETYLRKEAAQAAQLFEDLARLPNDLALCEPLQMDANQEAELCETLRDILKHIGVFDADELAEATNVASDVCGRVYTDPIRCDSEERAAVMRALNEIELPCLWLTDYKNGVSIGEALAAWLRDNFSAPFQFWRQAEECELKCYLVGTVSALTDDELSNLLYAPNLERVMKNAAATAMNQ